ncbi:MAG: uroporphyrinogen decarboxylase family protein, partial [Chloroflexota bacterium]|nr:uroporphyrinogen decarboxylase family protein [Chloroflexota bacterium]
MIWQRPDKPDFERFRKALRREEPDRVPLAELLVAEDVKAAFMGHPIRTLAEDIEFWQCAGYDFYPSGVGLLKPGEIVDAASQTMEAGYGLYQDTNTRRWAMEHEGAITSMADFERFPWPDANAFDLSILDEAAALLPAGMKIVIDEGKIFTPVWMLMGFVHFCLALHEDLPLVEKLFQRVGEFQYEVAQRVLQHPRVGALWMPDDLAYKTGLMLRPQIFRQYLFPWYAEIGKLAKAKNIPYIFHSDGRLWEVMEDIVAAGFDALHPIEPGAMDIYEVKERYGDKLALIGNMDLRSTLTLGTPADV